VSCHVRVGKKSVHATGTIVGGGGRCSLRVPAATRGSVLRGTITVRSGGKTVVKSFSYVVL
jgi:hypothetical protein